MLSRAKRRLDGVRGCGRYAYKGRKFTLDADTCDALRKVVDVAVEFRRTYIRKCKKEQRRIRGFRRDVQNANLMVLREFDRICTEHGFIHMLYNGTLLGAVRHAGFIPWDDDVDVIMPRGHYEKIIDIFNAESRIPALRARRVSPSRGNVLTKIEAAGEPMIYIDIFPLDCYADEPGEALGQRVKNLRRRIVGQVLPDKNPDATYRYHATFRSNLGLTPVAHDDPECRSVILSLDCPNGHVLDAKDIFPLGRMDFEGLPMPVLANPPAVLNLKYKNYKTFPLSMRPHSRRDELSVERMLSVKRFLRSDPLLRPVPLPRRRMDATERLRDRFLTLVRSLISPVFNVLTHDTLKEYRFFSRSIFRLRPDRVMLGHLEAIAMYSRLIQDETPAPIARGLLRQSQTASAEALSEVLRICGEEGLTCWLWLGSLLGAVRNGAFPATDREATLLMPRADYERFRPLCNALPRRTELRTELAFRHGGVATVVTMEGKPRVVVIPCDSCPDDWDRRIYAKCMLDTANKAVVESLKAENDLDGLYRHFASLRERMGIGGNNQDSIFPGWDCPELFGRCHALEAKYYTPSAKMRFECLDVPVPADHDIVLTSLYGDYQYPDPAEGL